MYQVGFEGFNFPDSQITVALAAGITTADIGKALAVDTGAANTLKLAGDGDTIVARLMTVENRVNEGSLVGTASFRFSARLPIKTGETVAVGDTVVGAGSGEVKALETADHNANFVAEIDGTSAIVVKI